MFREKHKKVFTDGRFMSDLLYTQSNGKIRSNGFLCGDHLAVILTNRQEETQEGRVSAEGYELCSFDSVRGDMRMENDRVILPECSLGILIFRKK